MLDLSPAQVETKVLEVAHTQHCNMVSKKWERKHAVENRRNKAKSSDIERITRVLVRTLSPPWKSNGPQDKAKVASQPAQYSANLLKLKLKSAACNSPVEMINSTLLKSG